MTPSTSDTGGRGTPAAPQTPANQRNPGSVPPTDPEHRRNLIIGVVVVVVLTAAMIGISFWRDKLTLGIIIFAGGGAITQLVRLYLTRQTPLAISSVTDAARQQILIRAVAAGGMVVPFIYMATPWLDFASYTLPVWAMLLGGVFYAAGLWFFWRSHADLGRYWSPVLEVREDHKLVTDGIYSRIRHPMYTAIFLFFIGQPLCIGNWIAGFSGLVAFGILYAQRVATEEKMLAETFGEEWKAYAARTGRLMPRL